MSKKGLKLTLCAAFACSLLLAACGGKETTDSNVKIPIPSAEETETVETQEAETKAPETKAPETEDSATDAAQASSAPVSGKFATVADFANSSEVQNQLEIQKKSLDGTGMDIAITGEDNKLIYTFTYLEMENQEGMAEALEQGLEAQKTTFVGVAKSIKLAVDVENPVVIVQYLDAKGEVIYSAEFTAD